jgi:hypothetical protein
MVGASWVANKATSSYSNKRKVFNNINAKKQIFAYLWSNL